MSTLSAVHTFQVKSKDAVVNADKGTIHGVSMITGDLEAKGHGLQVDKTTLKQIYECAVGMGKVPVKTNHGSGVDAVNGYLCNFRIDGDKVRGDWVLLKTYPTTPHLMEMAEKMPESVGLSVAFRGDPELADGTAVYFDQELKQHYTLKGGQRQAVVAGTKLFARCTELVSTDLVASPAANPEGMFSARGVDSGPESMANPSTSPVEIPAADAQMPDWAQALSDKLDSINERMDAMEDSGENDQNTISQEEIQAGLEDGTLVDNGDGTFSLAEQAEDADGDDDGSGEGEEGEGGEAAEGVPAEAAAAMARGDVLTAFSIMSQHAVNQALAARDAAEAKRQEVIAFNALQAKTGQLTEFAAQAKDQIEALQAENAELRKFASAKGKTSAGAETFFAAKPQGGGGQITTFEQATAHYATEFAKAAPAESKVTVQARAVEFATKHHPDLYETWQVARGIRPRYA
jgi:hypothetical protein